MTSDEVLDLIRSEVGNRPATAKVPLIGLEEMLLPPQRIQVIARDITQGGVRDELLDVWLVGQEQSGSGYRIVMSVEDRMFGLAASGFPSDRHLVLVGWYGDLFSAFVNM